MNDQEQQDSSVVMKGKVRRRKPTVRQVLALKYINQGMSKRQAMLKAGYSPFVAATPGKRLMNSEGVAQLLGKMQGELQDAGLTSKYMALKFKEWIEAKKWMTSHTEPDREVPDYDTQIKAFDRWEKAMGGISTQKGKVKRQLTVTEFIEGGDGDANNS